MTKENEIMVSYGLMTFDRKPEICVDELRGNHIFLTEDVDAACCNDKRTPNLLIEGENFHALKILNYTHQGMVDVIYIDPPYNTGNNDFAYEDKMVDKEDGFRHTKWLSFMSRRLELAKSLLKDTGVILISIDDNELRHLWNVCDQVFGEGNFLANLIWKKKATNGGMAKGEFAVNIQHEYVLAFAKDKSKAIINGVPGGEELDAKYKFKDDKGRYRLVDFAGYGLTYQPSLDYEIEAPSGKRVRANDVMGVSYQAGWRWSKETFEKNKDQIVWVGDKPKTKTRMNGDHQMVHPSSLLVAKELLANTDDTHKDVPELNAFDYRKPVSLIKNLFSIFSPKDAIILDFFAGSGTTGQAVAELNKEDNGTRQFILATNNENNICRNITIPRLKKTIGDEALKVFRIEKLPKDEFIGAQIEQLELNGRLTAIQQIRHNAYYEVESIGYSRIYRNAANNKFLGIYSNTSTKQKSLVDKELAAFRKLLKDKYPNHYPLLINQPRYGFAAEYFEFMEK